MNNDQSAKVIELQHVSYHYFKKTGYFSRNKFWALRGVSFTLFKGETLGVIGKNGAGKTTLLQLLAGITTPDEGRLINYGYTCSLLSLQAGFTLYLTGRENSILSGLMLGIDLHSIKSKLLEIQEFSGLGDFFDQPISSYSSGMRARLGFSIAFQLDPDVLLVDEVLGVGDEAFREKSTAMMRQKILSDKTVVLVSHAIQTVQELCNRVVWIEGGINKAVGKTDEVIRQYRDFLMDNEPGRG